MLWFQNNISKIIYTAAFIINCAFQSNAQLINIKDPAFRNALCTFDATVMSSGCSQLDTIKATLADGNIVLRHADISNADEIIFFKNVDTLRLSFNNLTTFPIDISRFRHLVRLDLRDNQLTNAPNIHYTNAFSGDTAIKLVYLLNNKITELPVSWNLYNNMTQVIDLKNNELTAIPSFINYPQIRRLDLSDNRLPFEYLIPVTQNPQWGVWPITLFPQKKFPVSMDTLVDIGDLLHVNISTGLASNEYVLILNNTIIETNRTGDFTISINSVADTGQYWFKIKNDNFTNASEFLQSEFKNVKLKPTNEKNKDVIVFSPNGDGNSDDILVDGTGQAKIINKSGTELKNISLPYIWDGTDKYGKVSGPGLYYIQKSDGSVLKVLLVN